MHHLRHYWPTLLILVAGIVLSGLVALSLHTDQVERFQRQLERLADRATLSVENKFALQSGVLRGGVALFRASDRVTQADWRLFVERQQLEKYNPGILGMGFAAYAATPGEANRLASAYRGEAFKPLWPEGERADYSVITFLEPENERNRAALSFDMLSESNRRKAMERARATGEPALSHKIELVQEIDEDKQAGFLLYLPATQLVGGEEIFVGWVYSPLRAGDLFSTIANEPLYEDVEISMYDGEPSEETLLYGDPEAEVLPFHVDRRVEIGGIPITVRASPKPAFYTPSPTNALIRYFVLGLVITALIASLVFQQQRQRARVERQVEDRTAALREANERLVAEADARTEAESQLRQVQKMEAVGQLSGGIAHDFNNMLAIITGNLDMAQHTNSDTKRNKALSRAMMGAEKAAELTQRLLAFSRRQTLLPESIDPNKLVREMSELLRRTLGANVRLETVLAGGLWPVTADPSQLENAIVNLAVNARDAMPDGGKLTIETANAHLDDQYRLDHADAPTGQFVCIAVTDTGTGMPDEVQAKAVEPFYTTKGAGKGTGLGLSQVFGFVKQSGGHFAIYSEMGEGTTIRLYLPRALDEAKQKRLPVSEDPDDIPRAKEGETVLVVEDERAVREMSVNALVTLGYQVVEASSGMQALEKLGEMERCDLLFTDVVMAGLDGRQLADAVSEECPDLPVLFTTGFTPNAIVHNERLDHGVNLLPKPFTLQKLARHVRSAIDEKTGA
ncbi:CHASE domain-containing protein [Sphingomicrobium clamense]|uniref:CHASE domain-containing protein n=1 Tax=Sphingomicrobium clamense TaxID=2851013 RepID=A0ABS6V4Z5_9SPHN|nr:CHASE domain-containing protein [Sphingomicrobium sp. B8]MBW0144630.1 CHASE domain-containing protein [Sphingomicrobium sp. B8]